jgi:fucose permease
VSLLGAAAGGLIASLLRFVRPYYQANAAYTISLCGSFFGAGCVLITAIFASAYWTYVAGWEAFLAVIPLVVLPFLTKISNTREHRQPGSPVHARLYKIVNELKSLPAILFSLLLFFQFGSEWTLAGWLPLLLIRRLGSSPEFGLFALTLYFAALLVGRLLAQAIRRKMPAVRLLIASVLVSILGYLLLSLTNSATGAALASVLTGLANAPIYGLVIEKIGRRFDAQPGFFNNIFSLAATGGMLMPCMIGFAAYYYGLQYVLIIPAFGAIAVLVLMSLVTLEAKLMAESTPATRDQPQQTMAAGAGRKP